MSSHSTAEVSAFNAVPDFAKGLVRDIRVRWACEEIDLPYKVRLIDGSATRPEPYLEAQPFGQVPAFWEGDLSMFESGAILLHLGETDPRLLPIDHAARKRAISWLFAALNTVEPPLTFLATIDFFTGGAEWGVQGRPMIEAFARSRLHALSDDLRARDWLVGDFSIADIAMICVLRSMRHTSLLSEFPDLAAYCAKGENRPAFQRAVAAQCKDFGGAVYQW